MKYLKKIFENIEDNEKLEESLRFYFAEFFDNKLNKNHSQITVTNTFIEINITFPVMDITDLIPDINQFWDQKNNTFDQKAIDDKLENIKKKQSEFYEEYMTSIKRLKENYPNIDISINFDYNSYDEFCMIAFIDRNSLN